MKGYHNTVGEIEGLKKNLKERKAFTANLITTKEKIFAAVKESNKNILKAKVSYLGDVDDLYGSTC